MKTRLTIPWVWRAGLLWAAGLDVVGWGLSAIHQLNATAYALVLTLAGLATVLWWRSERTHHRSDLTAPPLLRWRRHRWRRLLPAGFLGLAGLALLGGLLYLPNNIDALAYRTPRVLHWLAAEQWHWIPCPYQRLNVRATGFEWLTAPILALTHSDRPLFLLEFFCFLLLPGLVFTTLRAAGVRAVVAWRWMWLFPTGYCFAVQAGGIANDLYGATVSAAAAALAWRTRRLSGEAAATSLRWSGLALALATNAKTSNVLLGLPWLVLVAPALGQLRYRPWLTGVLASLALVASFLPQAALNWRQCGDWTGARAEFAWTEPPGAGVAVVHNTALWSLQNLLPPINPTAGKLNAAVESAVSESWKARLDAFAEGGRHAYAVRELPGEEFAGLGAGVSWWLILGAVVALRRVEGWRAFRRIPGPWLPAVLLAPWVALLIYGAKSAIQPNGRILAPFYLWVLPTFLIPGGRDFLTRPLRRGLELLVLGLAAMVVILTPARPLFPVHSVIAALGAPTPGSLAQRIETVYGVYGQRADAFGPLRRLVPTDVTQLGFITGNDAETSLWRPYGQRRLHHIPQPYSRVEFDRRGVTWVVVNIPELTARGGTSLEAWLRAVKGEVVHRQFLKLAAALEAQEYAVVRLLPNSP